MMSRYVHGKKKKKKLVYKPSAKMWICEAIC